MIFADFISGIRPKTIIASLSPIAIATGLVVSQDFPILWWVVALTILASLCIQIATNFINDAIDFKKGTDQVDRLGPQRLGVSGRASYAELMRIGFVFLALAGLFGLSLVWHGGWPILFIGIFSLFMAYGYTGGPYPLAYLGLGELFVILFFGIIAVMGVSYLLFYSWTWLSFFWGLLVGLQAASLILINNMRDVASDLRGGRKTLPLRIGRQASLGLLFLFLIGPGLFSPILLWQTSQHYSSILPLLVLPSGLKLWIAVSKAEPSSIYNQFLGQAGFLQWRWTLLVLSALIIPTL